MLCFFDPHGQALCKRTNTVIAKIREKNKHKLHYFLTKADTLTLPKERQKVLVQLAQSLTQLGATHEGDHALTVHAIFLPHKARLTEEEGKTFNELDVVVDLIDTWIKDNLQNQCQQFGRDSTNLLAAVENELATETRLREQRGRIRALRTFSGAMVAIFLLGLLVHLTHASLTALIGEWHPTHRVGKVAVPLLRALLLLVKVVDSVESSHRMVGAVAAVLLVVLTICWHSRRCEPSVRPAHEIIQFETWRDFLANKLLR